MGRNGAGGERRAGGHTSWRRAADGECLVCSTRRGTRRSSHSASCRVRRTAICTASNSCRSGRRRHGVATTIRAASCGCAHAPTAFLATGHAATTRHATALHSPAAATAAVSSRITITAAATVTGWQPVRSCGQDQTAWLRAGGSLAPGRGQGCFALEKKPETTRPETGHKRHYRTLGREAESRRPPFDADSRRSRLTMRPLRGTHPCGGTSRSGR